MSKSCIQRTKPNVYAKNLSFIFFFNSNSKLLRHMLQRMNFKAKSLGFWAWFRPKKTHFDGKWWRLLFILCIMVCLINVISSHIASNPSIKRKTEMENTTLKSSKVETIFYARISISLFFWSIVHSNGKKTNIFSDTKACAKFCWNMTLAVRRKKYHQNKKWIGNSWRALCRFLAKCAKIHVFRFNTEAFFWWVITSVSVHTKQQRRTKWKRTIDFAYNNRRNFVRVKHQIYFKYTRTKPKMNEREKTHVIITMIFTMGFALQF